MRPVSRDESIAPLTATSRLADVSGNARNQTALSSNSASSNEPMPRAKHRRALSKEQYSLILKGTPDNGKKPFNVAVSLAAMRRGHIRLHRPRKRSEIVRNRFVPGQ